MKWVKNLDKNKLLYGGLIITFVILYGATAFVSWYHSITFFNIANAVWLSVLLSFVAEIGQASVLFSILLTENKNKFLPWIIMILLTTLQVIGNVVSSYEWIVAHNSVGVDAFRKSILFFMPDGNGETFKVIIAWISGALLPVIALSMTALVAQNIKFRALHQGVSSTQPIEPIQANDLASEMLKVRPTEEQLTQLENILKEKTPLTKEEAISEDNETPKPKLDLSTFKSPGVPYIEREINEVPTESHIQWLERMKKETESNLPGLSDEKVYKLNLDEHERTGTYTEEPELTPEMEEKLGKYIDDMVIAQEEKEFIIPDLKLSHTNGLVDGIGSSEPVTSNTGDVGTNPGSSGSTEISPEAQRVQEEEERLERIRAVARENIKKK